LIFFIDRSFTTGPTCASAVAGSPIFSFFVFSTTSGISLS